MGRSLQEANQAMLYQSTGWLKNSTGWAHSGLGTDNHSLIWWKELGSQDLKSWLPKDPGPKQLPALPTIVSPGFRGGAMFLLHTSWSQEKAQLLVHSSLLGFPFSPHPDIHSLLFVFGPFLLLYFLQFLSHRTEVQKPVKQMPSH